MSWKQQHLSDVDFKFDIVIGSRNVSYTLPTIELNGVSFDLHDLFEALRGVKAGDIYIFRPAMCEHLLKLEVIRSCGSRRGGGATPGRRFDALFKEIERLTDEEDVGSEGGYLVPEELRAAVDSKGGYLVPEDGYAEFMGAILRFRSGETP
jgi:hypothetical protein